MRRIRGIVIIVCLFLSQGLAWPFHFPSHPAGPPSTSLASHSKRLKERTVLETVLGPRSLLQYAAGSTSGVAAPTDGLDEALISRQIGTHLRPRRPPRPAQGYLTPARNRRLGITHLGDMERLRLALSRLLNGGNLTVSVLGGSVSAGAGALDTYHWVQWLEDWLRLVALRPHQSRIHVRNGAVPGTTSAYMSVCYNMHVPRDVDVVVLEYSLNDGTQQNPPFNNAVRRPFERLIRKLLTFPNKPAVVILNYYAWFYEEHGLYHKTAEREFSELATYYSLPTLSVKACCYHLMAQGAKGFWVNRTRADSGGVVVRHVDEYFKGNVFYYDRIHPDGWTGHLVLSELVGELLVNATMESLSQRAVSKEDVHIASQPLPPPMIPGNYESTSDRCFMGHAFQECVKEHEGWSWTNDAPPGKKPKFGYISTTPGTRLTMVVNTTLAAEVQDGTADQSPVVNVELAYLRSYANMGRARVTCVFGCQCQDSVFDGNGSEHNSLLILHTFTVTQANKCGIQVEVLQDTSSGKHKVKLAAVMVSDERGLRGSAGNNAAVQMVHDNSGAGKYDIKTTYTERRQRQLHVRRRLRQH